jgi:hypothetical protein
VGQVEAALRDLVRDEVLRPLADKIDALVSEMRLRMGERQPPARASTPTPDRYFTRKQAAEMIGRSPRTVTRLIDSGRLHPCGPRREFIARVEIQRFMEQAPPPRQGNEDEDLARDADQMLDD